MKDFFQRLSYSFGNEDWLTEHKALRISPEDHILTITASGDRPLNLLLSDCKSILSIDANPIQNALLNLKCAALRNLSSDNYLSFLGLSHGPKRLQIFEEIKHDLSPEFFKFWLKQKKAIEKGILFEGEIEKWLLRVSHVLRFLRGEKISKLFSYDTISEQAEFVNKEWNTQGWRNLFKIFLHPFITKFFVKDPGLYEFVDHSIDIGTYIRSRVEEFMSQHLVKSNSLLSMLFQGKVGKEGLPPYLTHEGADRMRSKLSCLRWETIDLLSCVKREPSSSFNCFSLSDVASYISKPDFDTLTHEMVRTAIPGARFCIRQFMSNHSLPSSVQPYFKREPELEKELEKLDKCFVYRFMVGTIDK